MLVGFRLSALVGSHRLLQKIIRKQEGCAVVVHASQQPACASYHLASLILSNHSINYRLVLVGTVN